MQKVLAAKILFFVIFTISSLSSSFAGDNKEIKIDNIKDLAGIWRGYPYSPTTYQRFDFIVTIHIDSDGKYKAYGKMLVVGVFYLSDDNEMRFQSSVSTGKATLHEESGVKILRTWFDNGNVAGEYERVR